LHFLRNVILGIKVVATGVYHAGVSMVFNFFEDVQNDWHASFALPEWKDVQEKAEGEIRAIAIVEKTELEQVFTDANHERIKDQDNLGTLAEVEFHQDAGEYKDFANAIANGFGGFV